MGSIPDPLALRLDIALPDTVALRAPNATVMPEGGIALQLTFTVGPRRAWPSLESHDPIAGNEVAIEIRASLSGSGPPE